MLFESPVISPLQELNISLFQERGLRLFVKRDDLLHPQVSGNKWRKLKYNVLFMRERGIRSALTFGGAYSNHLYAFAAALQGTGISGIAVVRGEVSEPLNATLQFVKECGVHLHFVSRAEYRLRLDEKYANSLRKKFGEFVLIPEGGSNTLGVKGVSEVVAEINGQLDRPFNTIVTAVGSGGTLAGLVAGLLPQQRAIGIAVLKSAHDIFGKVASLSDYKNRSQWELVSEFHGGGHARVTPELVEFMSTFSTATRLPIEPIYTAKMFFALQHLAQREAFSRGQSIVALHTGGMQGITGMQQRYPELLQIRN